MLRKLCVTALVLSSLCDRNAAAQAVLPAACHYQFSNFVWWSGDDLRSELRQRIPGLTDQVVPGSPAEARIREALEILLRKKGIPAHVLAMEPPPPVPAVDPADIPPGVGQPRFTPQRQIVFSLEPPPEIVVSEVKLEGAPPDTEASLGDAARRMQGRPLDESTFAFQEYLLQQTLTGSAYLSAHVSLSHGIPQTAGNRITVPVLAKVDAGPQYKVAGITVDGGPLLRGRDLTAALPLRRGDVVSTRALLRFDTGLAAIYRRAGYVRAYVDEAPTLDEKSGLVAYKLAVVPGAQFHLGELVITHLDPAQEAKVRELLGFKTGQPYDSASVDALYTKVRSDSSFDGRGFSYKRKLNETDHTVNLQLDFALTNAIPAGTVTVR